MGIKEIAAAANVSPATVSNVLNGKNNVSVETRERILELCEAMGYSAGRHGKHNMQNANPHPTKIPPDGKQSFPSGGV